MKTQYSELYKKAQQEFENAEKNFDAKSNRKTAIVLSKARKQLSMRDKDKYTDEYLLERTKQRAEADEQMVARLSNLLNCIDIETSAQNGSINNDTRIILHKINDSKNPY